MRNWSAIFTTSPTVQTSLWANDSTTLDSEETLWFQSVYLGYLWLALIVGLPGNFLIAMVYLAVKQKRTSDWFIFFLSVYDGAVCVFAVPLYLSIETGAWMATGSDLACKIEQFTIFTAQFSSVSILGIIAVDRYLKICLPTTRSLNATQARNIGIGTPFLSALVAAPVLVWDGNVEHKFCRLQDRYKNTLGVKVHRCLTFGFFVCMFFVVIYCYSNVCVVVRRRIQRHREHALKRKHLMQIPAFLQAISNVDDPPGGSQRVSRGKRKFSLFSIGGSRRLSAITPWVKARLSLPTESMTRKAGLPVEDMELESKESLAESKKKLDEALKLKCKDFPDKDGGFNNKNKNQIEKMKEKKLADSDDGLAKGAKESDPAVKIYTNGKFFQLKQSLSREKLGLDGSDHVVQRDQKPRQTIQKISEEDSKTMSDSFEASRIETETTSSDSGISPARGEQRSSCNGYHVVSVHRENTFNDAAGADIRHHVSTDNLLSQREISGIQTGAKVRFLSELSVCAPRDMTWASRGTGVLSKTSSSPTDGLTGRNILANLSPSSPVLLQQNVAQQHPGKLVIPNSQAPKTMTPNSREPDSREPNSQEPNSREPNSREPNSREPNSREPNTAQPNTMPPNSQAPNSRETNSWETNSRETNTLSPNSHAPNSNTPFCWHVKSQKTEPAKTGNVITLNLSHPGGSGTFAEPDLLKTFDDACRHGDGLCVQDGVSAQDNRRARHPIPANARAKVKSCESVCRRYPPCDDQESNTAMSSRSWHDITACPVGLFSCKTRKHRYSYHDSFTLKSGVIDTDVKFDCLDQNESDHDDVMDCLLTGVHVNQTYGCKSSKHRFLPEFKVVKRKGKHCGKDEVQGSRLSDDLGARLLRLKKRKQVHPWRLRPQQAVDDPVCLECENLCLVHHALSLPGPREFTPPEPRGAPTNNLPEGVVLSRANILSEDAPGIPEMKPRNSQGNHRSLSVGVETPRSPLGSRACDRTTRNCETLHISGLNASFITSDLRRNSLNDPEGGTNEVYCDKTDDRHLSTLGMDQSNTPGGAGKELRFNKENSDPRGHCNKLNCSLTDVLLHDVSVGCARSGHENLARHSCPTNAGCDTHAYCSTPQQYHVTSETGCDVVKTPCTPFNVTRLQSDVTAHKVEPDVITLPPSCKPRHTQKDSSNSKPMERSVYQDSRSIIDSPIVFYSPSTISSDKHNSPLNSSLNSRGSREKLNQGSREKLNQGSLERLNQGSRERLNQGSLTSRISHQACCVSGTNQNLDVTNACLNDCSMSVSSRNPTRAHDVSPISRHQPSATNTWDIISCTRIEIAPRFSEEIGQVGSVVASIVPKEPYARYRGIGLCPFIHNAVIPLSRADVLNHSPFLSSSGSPGRITCYPSTSIPPPTFHQLQTCSPTSKSRRGILFPDIDNENSIAPFSLIMQNDVIANFDLRNSDIARSRANDDLTIFDINEIKELGISHSSSGNRRSLRSFDGAGQTQRNGLFAHAELLTSPAWKSFLDLSKCDVCLVLNLYTLGLKDNVFTSKINLGLRSLIQNYLTRENRYFCACPCVVYSTRDVLNTSSNFRLKKDQNLLDAFHYKSGATSSLIYYLFTVMSSSYHYLHCSDLESNTGFCCNPPIQQCERHFLFLPTSRLLQSPTVNFDQQDFTDFFPCSTNRGEGPSHQGAINQDLCPGTTQTCQRSRDHHANTTSLTTAQRPCHQPSLGPHIRRFNDSSLTHRLLSDQITSRVDETRTNEIKMEGVLAPKLRVLKSCAVSSRHSDVSVLEPNTCSANFGNFPLLLSTGKHPDVDSPAFWFSNKPASRDSAQSLDNDLKHGILGTQPGSGDRSMRSTGSDCSEPNALSANYTTANMAGKSRKTGSNITSKSEPETEFCCNANGDASLGGQGTYPGISYRHLGERLFCPMTTVASESILTTNENEIKEKLQISELEVIQNDSFSNWAYSNSQCSPKTEVHNLVVSSLTSVNILNQDNTHENNHKERENPNNATHMLHSENKPAPVESSINLLGETLLIPLASHFNKFTKLNDTKPSQSLPRHPKPHPPAISLTPPTNASSAIHTTLLQCLPNYTPTPTPTPISDSPKPVPDTPKQTKPPKETPKTNNDTCEFFVRSVFDALIATAGLSSASEPCLNTSGEYEELYEFPLFPGNTQNRNEKRRSGNLHFQERSHDNLFRNSPRLNAQKSISRSSGSSLSWFSLNDLDCPEKSARNSRFVYLSALRQQLSNVFSPKSLRQFFGINDTSPGNRPGPGERPATGHINVIITRCESLVMDNRPEVDIPPMRSRAATLDPTSLDKGPRASSEPNYSTVPERVIAPKPRASSLDTTHSSNSRSDDQDASIDRSRGCSLDLLSPASASLRTGSMCSGMSSVSRLTECSAYTEHSRSDCEKITRRTAEREHNITRLLGVITIIFVISWSVSWGVILYNTLSVLPVPDSSHVTLSIARDLFLVNHFCNIVVYAVLSKSFRDKLLQCCHSLKICC